jgi:hypothetical protein
MSGSGTGVTGNKQGDRKMGQLVGGLWVGVGVGATAWLIAIACILLCRLVPPARPYDDEGRNR